jgi:hypothetical protein
MLKFNVSSKEILHCVQSLGRPEFLGPHFFSSFLIRSTDSTSFTPCNNLTSIITKTVGLIIATS